MELRLYQEEALNKVRAAFSRPKRRRRVILYSPTGSGKTEMAMAMIRGAIARGLRTVFIVNRIGLVQQASVRFAAAGIAHGIIQGDNTRDPQSPVLICSIQTVARRGLPADIGLIVIDEAHGTAGSVDYRRFIAQRNLVPMVGLTATPFSRGLGKTYQEVGGPLWDELVVAATIRELIEQRLLVDVDIYAPSTPDLSGVPVVAGDYHQAKLGEAVDKPDLIGDIVGHWHRYAQGRPTVCFATNIAHSQHIVEAFRADDIRAEHLDCYTPEEERAEILARSQSGETTVLSNVAILAEGWDNPACEVMILARPTKSLIRYIQMSGRILRPFEGKERGLILDHSGSAIELGYPTDDLPLELDTGAPRKPSGAPDADKPELVECASCHFIKPRTCHVCPKCGFAPQKQHEVTTGDGELIRLKRNGRNIPEAEMRQFLAEMTGYAEAKGYKRGYAYHQFNDKYGVFPKDVGICWADPRPLTDLGQGWLTHRAIKRRHTHAQG